MRVQAENSVFRSADIVANETKVIQDYKRNIDRLADSVSSQPGVTQASADQIDSIKIAAEVLAKKGGQDLIESMQAVVEGLS